MVNEFLQSRAFQTFYCAFENQCTSPYGRLSPNTLLLEVKTYSYYENVQFRTKAISHYIDFKPFNIVLFQYLFWSLLNTIFLWMNCKKVILIKYFINLYVTRQIPVRSQISFAMRGLKVTGCTCFWSVGEATVSRKNPSKHEVNM